MPTFWPLQAFIRTNYSTKVLLAFNYLLRVLKIFLCLIFFPFGKYENFLTTKISRFMIWLMLICIHVNTCTYKSIFVVIIFKILFGLWNVSNTCRVVLLRSFEWLSSFNNWSPWLTQQLSVLANSTVIHIFYLSKYFWIKIKKINFISSFFSWAFATN